MSCANMRDVEWTLVGLIDSGILGKRQTDALRSARAIIANLRLVLNYDSAAVTTEDVMDLIFRRTGGEL
jgi:hypothetical protein